MLTDTQENQIAQIRARKGLNLQVEEAADSLEVTFTFGSLKGEMRAFTSREVDLIIATLTALKPLPR